MTKGLSSEERHARIWAVIKRIPRGKVATYGQVAAEAGFVKQPRLTAQALRHAPDELKLPWYRVINAQGKLSFERSEEHTSELQSLMRISYAVFCLKKHKIQL